jgi:hypothetical protein
MLVVFTREKAGSWGWSTELVSIPELSSLYSLKKTLILLKKLKKGSISDRPLGQFFALSLGEFLAGGIAFAVVSS